MYNLIGNIGKALLKFHAKNINLQVSRALEG